MENYISGKKASERLGVHQRTLYNWEKNKIIDTIRTPGNKRLYNVDKYLNGKQKKENIRRNICYARVSSLGQKDDLERQKKILINKYPDHELIEDIGSGMNLNKRGLKKIIHIAIKGELSELVIAHKDRLARFGFEIIKDLVETYSHGKIIILSNNIPRGKKDEMVEDILSIMNIYVAKLNGMRKYKHL